MIRIPGAQPYNPLRRLRALLGFGVALWALTGADLAWQAVLGSAPFTVLAGICLAAESLLLGRIAWLIAARRRDIRAGTLAYARVGTVDVELRDDTGLPPSRSSRRARPDSPPPEGVRIERADGTVIPCSVLRDPSQDENGCAAWLVVPDTEYEPGPGDAIRADMIPGRTTLVVSFTIPPHLL